MTVRLHGTHRPFSWLSGRPVRLMTPVQQRTAELYRISTDVHVTVDPDFYPIRCEHCDLGTLTSVRVYGREVLSTVYNPVVMEVCCHACALSASGPVARALIERKHPDQAIQIEVCE